MTDFKPNDIVYWVHKNGDDFKPNDIVYWVHKNGDKELCTVKEIQNDESMWVTWNKDGFVNIMPIKGFILADEQSVDSSRK